jgi:kynurenine formamidase
MNHNKRWKMIDLSQEIYEGNSLYPIHQPTFIFVNKTHQQSKDATGSRLGFSARNLLMSEHCATHSDAVWEYVPGEATIDEMSLDYFWGSAICVDLTFVPEDRYIEKEDLEKAVSDSGLTVEKGDIFLMYTGAWNRHFDEVLPEPIANPVLGYLGTDAYQLCYTGVSETAARWLAEKGVVNIGIDAPAIDHPEDNSFAGHYICGEYKISNTENLCNLDKVAGKRFLFMGLPLKIRAGSGSPIRAVAMLEE